MATFTRFVLASARSKPIHAIVGLIGMAIGLNIQSIVSLATADPPPWLTRWWVPWVFGLIGLWFIAYIFYRQSESERGAHVKPDMDLLKAVEHLRDRSKWGLGRMYHNPANDRLLLEEIDSEFRDAAAQGRVTVWGRPRHGPTGFLDLPTEVEIAAAMWPRLGLDLISISGETPHGACTHDIGGTGEHYNWLRVNAGQVYREWPPAFIVQRAYMRGDDRRGDRGARARPAGFRLHRTLEGDGRCGASARLKRPPQV